MSTIKSPGSLTTTVATVAGAASKAGVTPATPLVVVARKLSNGQVLQRAFPNLDNLQAYLVSHADGHDIDPGDFNMVAIKTFTS